MKLIAYFQKKKNGWDYENRNGVKYWLPTDRTIQKNQMEMLRMALRNSSEYERLEEESRRAPGSVVSSSFKFVDSWFYVREGKKTHKVGYVQIVDFAKRRVRIHWRNGDTPLATAMVACSAPPHSLTSRSPSRGESSRRGSGGRSRGALSRGGRS